MVSHGSDDRSFDYALPSVALIPLESLRLLSVLLLSAVAVAGPVLVLSAGDVDLRVQIGLCALALVVGARFGGRLADAVTRIISLNWFSAGWVVYFLWTGWVIVSLRDTSVPGEVSLEWVRLVMLQPLMLLLGSLRGGHRPGIVNALMLTIVTSHAGGAAAAGAVVGFVALLGFFLVFDHWRRMLGSYPVIETPSIFVPLRQAFLRVALVSAGLLTYFTFFPPVVAAAVADRIASGAPLPQPSMADLWGAAVQLGVAILVSAAVLYALGRFLSKQKSRRGKRGEELAEEMLASRVLGDSVLVDDVREPIAYSGPRGRVVRSYLALLATVEGSGGKRLPSNTARELVPTLSGTFPDAEELTQLFEAARYGSPEPTREDVKRAEALTSHLPPVVGLKQVIRDITRRFITAATGGGAARRPRPRPPQQPPPPPPVDGSTERPST